VFHGVLFPVPSLILLDLGITGLVEESSVQQQKSLLSASFFALICLLLGSVSVERVPFLNLSVNHGPLLAGQIPVRWCRPKLAPWGFPRATDVVVDRHLQL
jgi:hypothetical protein